jgi:hypothetical protein
MARRRRQITIRAVMIAIAVVALCLGALADPIAGPIVVALLIIGCLIAATILIAATAFWFSIIIAALLGATADLIGRLIHRVKEKA